MLRRACAALVVALLAPLSASGQDVTVAAASDLQVALPELAARFERASGFRVRSIFGSSGNISSQIQNGAPYDVFLSADIEYPRHLVELKLASPDAVVAYARGRLVLWTRTDSKVDLKEGLKGLTAEPVRRIAIANPEHAPYGRAAVAALRHEGVYDLVRGRLVLGENISQTAQFAQSGNADAGIIALSLALGPALRASGRYVEIPAEFHPPIEQAAVWMMRAKNQAAARQFVQFLQQPASIEYLAQMGFEAGLTLMDAQALILSVRLALVVSTLLLVIGLPVAYWLTMSRWRWKFLVEAIVALPLVLPPTVLGFYVLVAIGARSPIGRVWTEWFGHGLAFTFEGLVIASILYSLPFAVQPFTAAFSQIDRKLLDASAILGASRWRTFRRIMLPLSINGIVTGVVLSFAHTIGEFGVVVMVGGNLPGVTRTVSIAIYDDVQALNFARANTTALTLFAFSGLVLALVYALNRRVWSVQPEI